MHLVTSTDLPGTICATLQVARMIAGETDCDGDVGFDDITAFMVALTGQAVYPYCEWLSADVNCDVDFDDLNPFYSLVGTAAAGRTTIWCGSTAVGAFSVASGRSLPNRHDRPQTTDAGKPPYPASKPTSGRTWG